MKTRTREPDYVPVCTTVPVSRFRAPSMRVIGKMTCMLKCDVCGAEFSPVKPWQKRCSKKCSVIANNARKRADSSVKMCKTCRLDLPATSYLPAHRSCIACEDLHASGRKQCRACKQVKDFSEFHKRPDREHSHDSRCKSCRAASAKILNSTPERKARYRHLRYQRLYGVTLEEVEEMERRQQGMCAICGSKPQGAFHVDHDHSTGKARELLCNYCNSLLGQCSDRIEVLKKAIEYLERHSG